MTDIDTKRDKEIIEAATDGPWYVELPDGFHGGYVENVMGVNVCDFYWIKSDTMFQHPNNANNAPYIAHFNPEYLQQYIQEVERLTSQLAEKDAEVEQLKAREMRYVEAFNNLYEEYYKSTDWYDFSCDVIRITDEMIELHKYEQTLAQSPQQVEVYRAERVVIDSVVRNKGALEEIRFKADHLYESTLDVILRAVANYQAAIDKADKGE